MKTACFAQFDRAGEGELVADTLIQYADDATACRRMELLYVCYTPVWLQLWLQLSRQVPLADQ